MARIEDLPSECVKGDENENRNGNAERTKSCNYNHSPQSNTACGCSLMVGIMHTQSSTLPAFVGDSNFEEKGKPELGSLDCISVKHDIHSSFKRCKKNVISMRESFPEELIYNILLLLPAQIIHDVMRCICRRWYAMIRTHHFIHKHLLQSTAGLLVVRQHTPIPPYFVETQQGRIEVSRLHLGLQDIVWASCNGLVLVSDYHRLCSGNPLTMNQTSLCIVNPITKQRLTLPLFFHRMRYPHAGLAFVGSSQEYKVVCLYGNEFHSDPKEPKCAILTIGVDKVWRHIDVGHLSGVHDEVFTSVPSVTGDFVHWIHEKKIVSTLNLQTETFMQFPVPQVSEKRHKMFLEMGSNLSFLASCGPLSWEIWELNSETGEWTKLPNIDLEAQRCKLELLFRIYDGLVFPIHWLKPRELLIFRLSTTSNVWLIYDLKTREIQSFELEINIFSSHYVRYVNSLVWLEAQ